MQKPPLTAAMSACRRAFAVVAVISLGINVLMLTSAIYMMQIYDRVLTSRSVDTLIMLSIIVFIALTVLAFLDGLRTQMMVRVGGWFDRQLSASTLSSGMARSLTRGNATAQGLRDLSALRNYIGSPSVFPLFDAPFAPVFLAAIFLIHGTLGWIALGGAVALFVIGLINDRTTREASSRSNGASSEALNFADATVRNADAVAAMAMLPGLLKRLGALNGTAFLSQRLATDRSGVFGGVAKALRLLLQSAILGIGAWLVIQQEITAGVMIAASILMGRALAPVEQSISAWRAFATARVTYARLAELLGFDTPPPEATRLPAPTGALSVENAVFLPPGADRPVINNVSFALSPGQAMGLIGPIAAGKTTLARMIVGTLTPTRGHVRLDGADMARWDPVDRGQYIGYLPQEIELLQGSIRDNIARFTEAGDEEVVAAAQLAGVHEVILQLPAGYETAIGAGGIRLSGGQRQRIGLARAVFRMPKLLVLDEPNSNLDAVGEQALVSLIHQMRTAGSTVIIIAHRPRLLAQMDKVLVLRDGAAARFGDRDEVLAAVTQPPQAPLGGKPGGSVTTRVTALDRPDPEPGS